jgi:hypothetical protein
MVPAKPMFIGDTHKVYGKLAAIALLSGEKYYFFVKGRDVSMMPANFIEYNRLDAGKTK